MNQGMLAAIQAAGKNKGSLRKATKVYKEVSNTDDLAAALRLRAASKSVSEIAEDAAKRAEPLEHKIDRLVTEIARDQKKLLELSEMSAADKAKEVADKLKARQEKNKKLIEESKISVKTYRTALSSLKQITDVIRSKLMGEAYDSDSEVTAEMKTANPQLSGLLDKVISTTQEATCLKAEVDGFIKTIQSSSATKQTHAVVDESIKLEKNVSAAMKKLEASVAAYNKTQQNPSDQKDAKALVDAEVSRLNKAESKFVVNGPKDKNAIDPIQQKIDRAVDLLAAVEEFRQDFAAMYPEAVDVTVADDSAEVIANLKKKLAEAEAKLERHERASPSTGNGSSSSSALDTDGNHGSDSEDDKKEQVSFLRNQLSLAMSAAGGVHHSELEKLVDQLREENARLVDELDRSKHRDKAAKDLERRTMAEVENHRLAALKLQDDAVRLKDENDRLLQELSRGREEDARLNTELQKLRNAPPRVEYRDRVVNAAADNSKRDEIANLKAQLKTEKDRFTAERMISSFVSGVGSSISSIGGFVSSNTFAGYAAGAAAFLTVADKVALFTAPQHALLSNTLYNGFNIGNCAAGTLTGALHFTVSSFVGTEIANKGMDLSDLLISAVTTAISTGLLVSFSGMSVPAAISFGIATQALGVISGYAANSNNSRNTLSALLNTGWAAMATATAVDCASRLMNRGFGPLTHFDGDLGFARGVVFSFAPLHIITGGAFGDSRCSTGVKATALVVSAAATAAMVAAIPASLGITPAVIVGANVVAVSMCAAAKQHGIGYSR